MKRFFPSLFALVVAVGLAGCPREPNAPDPGMGTPCESLEDCNDGVTCGELKLCVDGFCEEGRSLIRACPGAGDPVVPPGD
jgi:hypothetical protein